MLNQVGLTGLKPTVLESSSEIIYKENPVYGWYPATNINNLKNTEIFADGALNHIFDGDVYTRRGQEIISGYHSNDVTGIPTIDLSSIIMNPITGVYKAKVINPITGTVKSGNQGYSTFFPDNWTAQQKADSIDEAYTNRVFDIGNQYTGTYGNIKIRMYLDANKKIISAFPEF